MSDLRELYQEVILDHGRNPRNFGTLPNANCHHEGFNPLCGDKIIVHVFAENGVIKKINFEGTGCAISIASASLMTEVLLNKNISEMEEIFSAFHNLVTKKDQSETDKLDKLMVLAGVAEFPIRVKCATLAWHTLKAGLKGECGIISTENNDG